MPTLHRTHIPARERQAVLWGGFAFVLIVAPLVFQSGLALTALSQMGYMIIICLSYNLLLGQGGMLSFGHAVYTGLGAFCAAHALNHAGAEGVPLPVSLVPLVGGLGGAAVAAVLGWVSTRKAHVPFAMITMGVGELVFAMTPMFPGLFGGEGGVSTNRVVGEPVFGITFGPQIQLYYLIATYCFACTALMFLFTATPLGRMLNAVRDNPERVAFVGCDPQTVRYIAFVIAGFFAGIGGGLFALNFELVQGSAVGGLTSASYLLYTYIGGTLLFFGPIIGAILSVLVGVLLSEFTKAWALYLGLAFMLIVMYAPGGLSAILMANLRVAASGKFCRLVKPGSALLAATPVWLAGVTSLVEMTYHRQIHAPLNPTFRHFGVLLDVSDGADWAGAAALALVGGVLFECARRGFVRHWRMVQEEMHALEPGAEGAS